MTHLIRVDFPALLYDYRMYDQIRHPVRPLAALTGPCMVEMFNHPLSSPLVSLATPAFVGARAGCIPFDELWTAGLNSYGDVTGLVVDERAWLPYVGNDDDEDMMSLTDIELFNVFARTEVVVEQAAAAKLLLITATSLKSFHI